MFSWFRRWLTTRPTSPRRSSRPARFTPRLEAFEERLVPSVNPTPVLDFPMGFHVLEIIDEFEPMAVTATWSQGSVVVWVELGETFDDRGQADIKAQRLDRDGNLLGDVITVSAAPERESRPAVGIDATGSFVIAWNTTISETATNVQVARYNWAGEVVLGPTNVAGTTAEREENASVALGTRGEFTVCLTRGAVGSDSYLVQNKDVIAANYYPVSSGGYSAREFLIAASPAFECQPSIARLDRRLVVAYATLPAPESGVGDPHPGTISLKNYKLGAAGTIVSSTTRIVGTEGACAYPSVSLNAPGTLLVAWQEQLSNFKWAIRASQFTPTNAVVLVKGPSGVRSAVMEITTTSGSDYIVPSVALRANGSFIIGYERGLYSGLRSPWVAEVKLSGTTATRKTMTMSPAATLDSHGYLVQVSAAPDSKAYLVVWVHADSPHYGELRAVRGTFQ